MTLGQRGVRGAGADAFCKPTQVAVGRNGSIYVSDGYCNARVAEFAPDGTWVRDYTLPAAEGAMQVPHRCARLCVFGEASASPACLACLPAGLPAPALPRPGEPLTSLPASRACACLPAAWWCTSAGGSCWWPTASAAWCTRSIWRRATMSVRGP